MTNCKVEMFETKPDSGSAALNGTLAVVFIAIAVAFGGAAYAQQSGNGGAVLPRGGTPPAMVRPDAGAGSGGKTAPTPGARDQRNGKGALPHKRRKGPGGCRFRQNDLGLMA